MNPLKNILKAYNGLEGVPLYCVPRSTIPQCPSHPPLLQGKYHFVVGEMLFSDEAGGKLSSSKIECSV